MTPPPDPPNRRRRQTSWPWIELVKVLALPLVTLVLGYWFNSSLNERQQVDSNIRLYAEMMGRREEADSNLRKDMFNSILTTFMSKDPSREAVTDEELIRQQILSLELLAYNFHESLDIAPLFKDVERRIPAQREGHRTGAARPARVGGAAGDRAPAHGAVRRRDGRARRRAAREDQGFPGAHHVRHARHPRPEDQARRGRRRVCACRWRPPTARGTIGSSGSS